MIGVINLNEIQNWSEIKKISRWVNVTFEEKTDNRNTSHPSFNFTTNNKEDLLNFTLNTDNKLIEFANGEKKISNN